MNAALYLSLRELDFLVPSSQRNLEKSKIHVHEMLSKRSEFVTVGVQKSQGCMRGPVETEVFGCQDVIWKPKFKTFKIDCWRGTIGGCQRDHPVTVHPGL